MWVVGVCLRCRVESDLQSPLAPLSLMRFALRDLLVLGFLGPNLQGFLVDLKGNSSVVIKLAAHNFHCVDSLSSFCSIAFTAVYFAAVWLDWQNRYRNGDHTMTQWTLQEWLYDVQCTSITMMGSLIVGGDMESGVRVYDGSGVVSSLFVIVTSLCSSAWIKSRVLSEADSKLLAELRVLSLSSSMSSATLACNVL